MRRINPKPNYEKFIKTHIISWAWGNLHKVDMYYLFNVDEGRVGGGGGGGGRWGRGTLELRRGGGGG